MYKKSPSKLWRKFENRYFLEGNKSKKSGKAYYPPIRFETGNDEGFDKVEYKKTGKLISWTEVISAPSGFENMKPYIIGIIELEDGEKLTSQIVDTSMQELQKGDIMIPTFRKIYADGKDGIIHYGLKWMKAV